MSGVGLNVGSTPVTAVYVGSTPVREVYVGSKMVWSATVQIILGTGREARDQLRAALSDRGLDYRTVQEIPFDIELAGSGSAQNMFQGCAALTHAPVMDTSQVTNMYFMFYACRSLTHVPDMDTRNVTRMENMFQNCEALTSIPAMDTSSVTNMTGMFYTCAALTHVPDLNTSNVTNMSYMFQNCSSLTDGNVLLIGRHPNVNTTDMILGSGLTRLPFYDTNGNPI